MSLFFFFNIYEVILGSCWRTSLFYITKNSSIFIFHVFSLCSYLLKAVKAPCSLYVHLWLYNQFNFRVRFKETSHDVLIIMVYACLFPRPGEGLDQIPTRQLSVDTWVRYKNLQSQFQLGTKLLLWRTSTVYTTLTDEKTFYVWPPSARECIVLSIFSKYII